jgi:hypothetical protein
VITITGIGDHLRPEWPITITGIRTLFRSAAATPAWKNGFKSGQSPISLLNVCRG